MVAWSGKWYSALTDTQECIWVTRMHLSNHSRCISCVALRKHVYCVFTWYITPNIPIYIMGFQLVKFQLPNCSCFVLGGPKMRKCRNEKIKRAYSNTPSVALSWSSFVSSCSALCSRSLSFTPSSDTMSLACSVERIFPICDVADKQQLVECSKRERWRGFGWVAGGKLSTLLGTDQFLTVIHTPVSGRNMNEDTL